jgi:hypothetical protein
VRAGKVRASSTSPPRVHLYSPRLANIAFNSSTAVLCVARAHRAEEALDESAASPHCAAPAAWCLEDRRSATSGVNEGAERAYTRDWPARHGCEVRELEHGYRGDVEVHPRSRSASSTRTRLRSPDSTRTRIPTTGL